MRLAASLDAGVRFCAVAWLAGMGASSATAIERDDFVVPDWVHPMNPSTNGTPRPPDDRMPLRVPNSRAAFTRAQVKDLFAAPDWHPESHASMPGIVARGRKPSVYACGYCHLPDGTGRPENAPLAGLPAEYIVAQVAGWLFVPADGGRTEPLGQHRPRQATRDRGRRQLDAALRRLSRE